MLLSCTLPRQTNNLSAGAGGRIDVTDDSCNIKVTMKALLPSDGKTAVQLCQLRSTKVTGIGSYSGLTITHCITITHKTMFVDHKSLEISD